MQITHWHGSTSWFKDDGVLNVIHCKRVKFDPTVALSPKPSNRWPPNLAWVTTPTPVQIFYHDLISGGRSSSLPFLTPCSRRSPALADEYTVTPLVFFGGAFFLFSRSPCIDFTISTSNDVVSRKNCLLYTSPSPRD